MCKPQPAPPFSTHGLILVILSIFISTIGFLLALICIYSLPDKSVKPFDGSLYFCGTSILIASILIYQSKRERIALLRKIADKASLASHDIIIIPFQDSLTKWLVTISSFAYVFICFTIGLICIYALPDKTVQPLTGALYFLNGSLILSVFLIVIWKHYKYRAHDLKA